MSGQCGMDQTQGHGSRSLRWQGVCLQKSCTKSMLPRDLPAQNSSLLCKFISIYERIAGKSTFSWRVTYWHSGCHVSVFLHCKWVFPKQKLGMLLVILISRLVGCEPSASCENIYLFLPTRQILPYGRICTKHLGTPSIIADTIPLRTGEFLFKSAFTNIKLFHHTLLDMANQFTVEFKAKMKL